jgi:hypothetical protein
VRLEGPFSNEEAGFVAIDSRETSARLWWCV